MGFIKTATARDLRFKLFRMVNLGVSHCFNINIAGTFGIPAALILNHLLSYGDTEAEDFPYIFHYVEKKDIENALKDLERNQVITITDSLVKLNMFSIGGE